MVAVLCVLMYASNQSRTRVGDWILGKTYADVIASLGAPDDTSTFAIDSGDTLSQFHMHLHTFIRASAQPVRIREIHYRGRIRTTTIWFIETDESYTAVDYVIWDNDVEF